MRDCHRDGAQKRLRRIVGKGNWALLNQEERRMASTIVCLGHTNVFRGWPPPGMTHEVKFMPACNHSNISQHAW